MSDQYLPYALLHKQQQQTHMQHRTATREWPAWTQPVPNANRIGHLICSLHRLVTSSLKTGKVRTHKNCRSYHCNWLLLLCPRLGGIMRWSASGVSPSDVAYIGSKSKTKRPRKTKLCTGVPQVTCDSHTDFKVKRLKVKVTRRGHIVAAAAQLVFFYSTGTSLLSNEYIWDSACSHFITCIKGPNTGSF